MGSSTIGVRSFVITKACASNPVAKYELNELLWTFKLPRIKLVQHSGTFLECDPVRMIN